MLNLFISICLNVWSRFTLILSLYIFLDYLLHKAVTVLHRTSVFFRAKKMTTRGEYLRSARYFVRNLILRISAWNYSKGPSKLNRAEDLDMFFLCSTTGVYKDTSTFLLFSLCLPLIIFVFGLKSRWINKMVQSLF